MQLLHFWCNMSSIVLQVFGASLFHKLNYVFFELFWRLMICIWNFYQSQNSWWRYPMICKYFSFHFFPCIFSNSLWKVLVDNILPYNWYQLFLFSIWSLFLCQRTVHHLRWRNYAQLLPCIWICICFQSI